MIACKHLIENNYFTRFGEIQRSYAPAVKLRTFTTGIGIKEGNAVGITVRHNMVPVSYTHLDVYKRQS